MMILRDLQIKDNSQSNSKTGGSANVSVGYWWSGKLEAFALIC